MYRASAHATATAAPTRTACRKTGERASRWRRINVAAARRDTGADEPAPARGGRTASVACSRPPPTASAAVASADDHVGATGAAASNSAPETVAIIPASASIAHGSAAAAHHSAATTTNTGEYADVNAPNRTAAPIVAETSTTRRTRTRGPFCSAAAPAIAAVPATATADPGGPHRTAISTAATTASRLCSTGAGSGNTERSARPVFTRPFWAMFAEWRK